MAARTQKRRSVPANRRRQDDKNIQTTTDASDSACASSTTFRAGTTGGTITESFPFHGTEETSNGILPNGTHTDRQQQSNQLPRADVFSTEETTVPSNGEKVQGHGTSGLSTQTLHQEAAVRESRMRPRRSGNKESPSNVSKTQKARRKKKRTKSAIPYEITNIVAKNDCQATANHSGQIVDSDLSEEDGAGQGTSATESQASDIGKNLASLCSIIRQDELSGRTAQGSS